MAPKWPKYGFLTPESVKAFRSAQQPKPAKKPKPRRPAQLPKPAGEPQQQKSAKESKQKRKRRSVWAIPTSFESNRRKH